MKTTPQTDEGRMPDPKRLEELGLKPASFRMSAAELRGLNQTESENRMWKESKRQQLKESADESRRLTP